MKVYRAMCEAEFYATMKSGKPTFKRKVKWFSPSLEFILSRVRDGKFNNSKWCPWRYEYVIEFEAEVEKADWYKGEEIQFNVRRGAKIEVIGRVIFPLAEYISTSENRP